MSGHIDNVTVYHDLHWYCQVVLTINIDNVWLVLISIIDQYTYRSIGDDCKKYCIVYTIALALSKL